MFPYHSNVDYIYLLVIKDVITCIIFVLSLWPGLKIMIREVITIFWCPYIHLLAWDNACISLLNLFCHVWSLILQLSSLDSDTFHHSVGKLHVYYHSFSTVTQAPPTLLSHLISDVYSSKCQQHSVCHVKRSKNFCNKTGISIYKIWIKNQTNRSNMHNYNLKIIRKVTGLCSTDKSLTFYLANSVMFDILTQRLLKLRLVKVWMVLSKRRLLFNILLTITLK